MSTTEHPTADMSIFAPGIRSAPTGQGGQMAHSRVGADTARVHGRGGALLHRAQRGQAASHRRASVPGH